MVSRVYVPDEIDVEALRNALWINSKFWDDLYVKTLTLQDTFHRDNSFIMMEEDMQAYLLKHNRDETAINEIGGDLSRTKTTFLQ